MPDWSPNWTDVRWDHDAASTAISRLGTFVSNLEDLAKKIQYTLPELSNLATPEEMDQVQDKIEKLLKLADHYRKMSIDIARTSKHATDEQNRRIRDRERWEQERDNEINSNSSKDLSGRSKGYESNSL